MFAEGAPSLRKQPSALLVSVSANLEPGLALDLGIGEGRNAFYLGNRGWKVTGVDISDVAVNQVNKRSSEQNVQSVLSCPIRMLMISATLNGT